MEKLEELHLEDNNFQQDLSFLSGLVNLKNLKLYNNQFHGSLEYLQGMSKLETLFIDNTDLDSGLEYLPKSIKSFNCLVNKKTDAKVQVIYNFLEDVKGENFSQKLQEYKEKIKQKHTLIFQGEGVNVDNNFSKIIQGITERNFAIEDVTDTPERQLNNALQETEQQAQIIQPPYGTPGSSGGNK